jgi:hypothetical protein
MQAVRERMVELDFKEKFVGQLLKEYPVEKIERKLDLLMERRNIQSPAGWLRAALKHDYRDGEQERYDEEPTEKSEDPVNTPEWTSREKALEAINLIKDNLSLCPYIPPPLRGKDHSERKFLNQKLKTVN